MTAVTKASIKHITTKELPTSVRPRERMAAAGPESMSASELIAIILGTGTKGITSIRLAENIMYEFDDRIGRLGQADLEELAGIGGVGPAKACQVLAAIELGKRVAIAKPSRRESLTSPERVACLLMARMRDLEREHFVALIVDTKIRLKKEVDIAIGGLNAAVIHPRDLFKAAIRANGSGLIVAHNHPSGDTTPSREDIVLTKRLSEAGKILGIEFHDHVIIGDGRWLSLKEKGYFS
jgi:DNA repair protein RadC